MKMKMRIVIKVLLAIAVVGFAAFAYAGGDWTCVGSRHKGDGKATPFRVLATGPADKPHAEQAVRDGEAVNGWTVDAVSCSQPDMRAMPRDYPGQYTCRGLVSCVQANTEKTDQCTARRNHFYAESIADAQDQEIKVCRNSVVKRRGDKSGGWACKPGDGFICFMD